VKTRVVRSMIAIVVVVIAAAYGTFRYSEYSRRETYIARCVDDGAGAMFSSRESCEALYVRGTGKR
jgi:hypothetical protein